MAAKRIAVTGGYGFIGSALVRLLLSETDHEVLNIDKLTYAANPASIPAADGHPRYRFVKADIADAAAMRKAFEEFQPDAVMHLAAESHVDRSIDGPREFIATNIVGTFTLLQEALRYWRGLPAERAAGFRFLHVSTDEVFGSLGAAGLFTEETLQPQLALFGQQGGLGPSGARVASHLRPAGARHQLLQQLRALSVSGEADPAHDYQGAGGEPLPVYGDGQNIRDWLFVDDHARALLLAVESGVPGETYNIGGNNERTNLQVVETICGQLDQALPSSHGPRRRLIAFVADRPDTTGATPSTPRKSSASLAGRAKDLRNGHRRDGPLVPRQSRLVASGFRWRL